MSGSPSGYYTWQNILRHVTFGCLGAVLGYFPLGLIAPQPFSHKVEWLVSPPVLALAGAILGLVFALKMSLSTAVTYLGGAVGLIVGHYAAPILSMLLGFLWYDVLHFEKPLDTFAFLDSMELLLWLLLGASGAVAGWLATKVLLSKHS
jgi:hypothetical protein